ncbi:MAG: flagellar biosynthetic protein FliR [Myxococcota bacterium]|nr:flagellar biosynthetic protein FliR [Myxococcota bacterium]
MSYALVFARVATALRLMPMLGGGVFPAVVWLALSSALSLALLASPGAPGFRGESSFLSAVLVQVAAGAVIGTAGRLAYALLEIPGGLATAVMWPDAPKGGPGPDLANVYGLFGVAALFAAGGHRALIALLSASFVVPFDASETLLTDATARLAASLLTCGVLLALPALSCGLLAEAVAGLLERLWGSPMDLPLSALRQLGTQIVCAFAFVFCASRFVESCAGLVSILGAGP